MFWKYDKLKNFVVRGPRFTKVWHDSKRNKDHYSWYFHTKSTETLGLLHKLFYPSGAKIVPFELMKILDPIGLAVWFMDDGSNNGNSLTLNTHCFSNEEQGLIQSLLLNKFKIRTTLVKDRSKFKIAIGSHEYRKFLDIVSPHVDPSMSYKIFSPRNDLIQKRIG